MHLFLTTPTVGCIEGIATLTDVRPLREEIFMLGTLFWFINPSIKMLQINDAELFFLSFTDKAVLYKTRHALQYDRTREKS